MRCLLIQAFEDFGGLAIHWCASHARNMIPCKSAGRGGPKAAQEQLHYVCQMCRVMFGTSGFAKRPESGVLQVVVPNGLPSLWPLGMPHILHSVHAAVCW